MVVARSPTNPRQSVCKRIVGMVGADNDCCARFMRANVTLSWGVHLLNVLQIGFEARRSSAMRSDQTPRAAIPPSQAASFPSLALVLARSLAPSPSSYLAPSPSRLHTPSPSPRPSPPSSLPLFLAQFLARAILLPLFPSCLSPTLFALLSNKSPPPHPLPCSTQHPSPPC